MGLDMTKTLPKRRRTVGSPRVFRKNSTPAGHIFRHEWLGMYHPVIHSPLFDRYYAYHLDPLIII